jgi:hypothetical protein
MRQLLLGVSLAASVAAGQAQGPQGPPAREIHQAVGHSTIDGVVNAVADGRSQPLRRARVVAATGAASYSTDTDTSGRFHLDQLPAGAYRITVSKFGFVPAGGVAPTVVLPDGQSVTTTVTMERGAVIEGQLTRTEGGPAIGLNVSAVRVGFGPYGKRPVSIQDTTTDDLGHYRLHSLVPGEYYVLAAPDPLRALNERGTIIGAPKPTPTYFAGGAQGSARLDGASPMTLTTGQEATGVDFTLASDTYATLVVKPTMASGAPPTTWTIRIQRVGAPYGEVRCFLLPPEPGSTPSATCSSVPPGDFWVLVTARTGGPNTAPEFGSARITMAGRDMRGATVTTAAFPAVQGRVEADGGGALPPGLRVVALETDYEYPSGAGDTPAVPPAAVGADGTFTFAGLPGPRLFRVQGLPQDWALSAVYLGADEISDSPKAFAESGAASRLRVVVTPQSGSVTGIVLDTNGRPKAGARVVVFSTDSRQWHVRSRGVATAEVGADGRYVVHGLLPGKFMAAVVDRMADGAWEDPDVIGRLQPSAVAVTITAGAAQTLDWRPR